MVTSSASIADRRLRSPEVMSGSATKIPKLNFYFIYKDDNRYAIFAAELLIAMLVKDRGFLEVSDNNPMVVANAVAALSEIQDNSIMPICEITIHTLSKLLTALNECIEWGQGFIFDADSKYKATDAREAENDANCAVVLSAAKMELITSPDVVRNLYKKMALPLVTLPSSEPEIQYVALRNINLRRPTHEIKVFYCEYSSERCIGVILELSKIKATLCESLDTLDEPEDKELMVWIIGEDAGRIDNADELLESFLENFAEEPAQVHLQLLTATEEPEAAKDIVLAEKTVIGDDSKELYSCLLDVLLANIATLSSVYHKPHETSDTLVLQKTEGSEGACSKTSSAHIGYDEGVTELSDDLVTSVLSFLPGLRLFKLLAVSKDFEKMIRNVLKSKSNRLRFLLPVSTPFHSVIAGDNPPPYSMALHQTSIQGLDTLIAGSVEDIIFVVCCGFETRFYLYNPTIGADTRIPRNSRIPGLSLAENSSCFFSYGFGYGESMNDLKVVTIQKSGQGVRVCDVFSFRQNGWTCFHHFSSVAVESNAGIFLPRTRSLYWLGAITGDHVPTSYFILGMDLIDHVFSEVQIHFVDGVPVNHTLDGHWVEGFSRRSLNERFPDGFSLLSMSDGKLLLHTINAEYRNTHHRHSILTVYSLLDDSFAEVNNLETLGYITADNPASPYVDGPTNPSDL